MFNSLIIKLKWTIVDTINIKNLIFMINIEQFTKSVTKFEEQEKNEGDPLFYSLLLNLIKGKLEVESILLMLTTWNSALYRVAKKNEFKIAELKTCLEKIQPDFYALQNENLKSINFDNYTKEIKTIYENLSKIKVIKYTGASKIMHLMNPKVFIMWDSYIRGEKAEKYYDKLNKAIWQSNKYGTSSYDYLKFLKDMKDKFKNIDYPEKDKTFAKAIDEYNIINITNPILDQIKKDERERKKRKSKT